MFLCVQHVTQEQRQDRERYITDATEVLMGLRQKPEFHRFGLRLPVFHPDGKLGHNRKRISRSQSAMKSFHFFRDLVLFTNCQGSDYVRVQTEGGVSVVGVLYIEERVAHLSHFPNLELMRFSSFNRQTSPR